MDVEPLSSLKSFPKSPHQSGKNNEQHAQNKMQWAIF